MINSLKLLVIFVFMGILFTSFPIQSADARPSFTNTKTATGVIMKFCSNHAITMHECNEKYEGYTWTDRVNVLIYAPGWNTDENRMEHIGQNFGSKITVSTRDSSVDNVVFTETGPDTGVFFGVIKLTGQHFTVHDQRDTPIKAHGHVSSNFGEVVTTDCKASSSGGGHGHGFIFPLIKLKTMLFSAIMTELIPSAYGQMHGHMMHMKPACQDGITGSAMDVAARLSTDYTNGAVTVSWEANEDVVITKTATWSWRIGEISFDKEMFSVNEPITFTLHDADLWIHHAEFFTYWMRVYSDSDQSGIFVPVQFIPNHDHGSKVEYEGVKTSLTSPAASSLTKYTPDGKWKTYFWWEPGGVLGVNEEYTLNLMVHDGLTDIHQTKLGYDVEVYLNGELVSSKKNQFSGDGHALLPVKFSDRGSAKIVFNNIFEEKNSTVSFSFQVAPEAIIEENVPRHPSFSLLKGPEKDYVHTHFIDILKGQFYVTLDDESHTLDKLRVSSGDTVTVEYVDMTLPEPYSRVDDLDIQARTVVFDMPGVYNPDTSSESIIKDVSGFTKSSDGIKKIIESKTDEKSITSVSMEIKIPSWIKKNASWWSNGQINDPDFAKGIEYLIQENIIDLPVEQITVNDENDANITSIPMWVRNNASWWSDGYMTDVEFANGIKYLVSSGLIKV